MRFPPELTAEAHPMSQLPTPDRLRTRIMARRRLPAVTKEIQPLLTPSLLGKTKETLFAA